MNCAFCDRPNTTIWIPRPLTRMEQLNNLLPVSINTDRRIAVDRLYVCNERCCRMYLTRFQEEQEAEAEFYTLGEIMDYLTYTHFDWEDEDE